MDTKVHVDLGARSYDIVIERGMLARAGEMIRQVLPKGSAFVITDSNVQKLHAKSLLQSFEAAKIPAKVFSVAAGEASKDFKTLETLVNDLISAGITRGDFVVAFGGGVIGDLAGFAASITLRGVSIVQIPTTLLSQVDSSVGGKTGINLPAGKNLAGAFHQPKLVLIDPDMLGTLDERQLRAGYAETVKAALIRDAEFFDWLEKNAASVLKNTPAQAEAIAKACRMKADIVARDERESGERMLLNFGHTFGHALEAATNYDGKILLHGEAVAIGMAMALRFSVQLGLCPAEDARRAIAHLEQMNLPVSAKKLAGMNAENLLNTMLKDKKVTDGRIGLILTRRIGDAFASHDISTSTLTAFLQQELG